MEQMRKSIRKPGIIRNRFGDIRSGWKITLMWVLFFVLIFLYAFIIGRLAAGGVGRALASANAQNLVQELCEIGSVLIIVYVVERRRLEEFGLPTPRSYLRDISYGFCWGAGSMISIFLILFVSGNLALQYSLLQPQWSAELLLLLLLMILVAFGEEMMSRGYTLTVLHRQTGNRAVAVGVSAVIFAIAHTLNPNAAPLGILNIALYGVVAGLMYLRSGSLWMPIAYHATWDYFEGNIFGFPNSGNTTVSFYPVRYVKSNIFTGGGFGPEGGVLVTFILILTLLWLFLIYRPRRSSVVGPDVSGS